MHLSSRAADLFRANNPETGNCTAGLRRRSPIMVLPNQFRTSE